MSDAAIPAERDFTFSADWEWCDAKVTYRPPWKSLGSTPRTLKLSPSRAYRVSVKAETTAADFAAILKAAPACNIRVIRVPHGGPISAHELGKVLAKLKGVEFVGMSWPYDSISWFVDIGASGKFFQLDLENWPVAEVTAALGQIPRAAALNVRMDQFKDNFSLRPLLEIPGLKTVNVQHCHYHKQELDWSGLSAQTRLQKIDVSYGFLNELFWTELGKLPRLCELELQWPEMAKSQPGCLSRLTSLKKLKGNCLFDHIPDAFQALASCPAIEAVKIEQAKLDDASAAALGAIKKLKDCYIWNTELSDAGMRDLCRWPQVKALVLCENSSNPTRITDAGFEALGNLTTLELLHLQGFDAVSAAGWAVLQRLKRLKRLQLMSMPAFDLMEAIGPLRSVEKLHLSYCNSVGPAGLRHLKAMPRLKSLNLTVHRYSPYHVPLDELSELRPLTSLYLGSLDKMTDEQLGRLAGLGNLEELFLYEAFKVTDRGIAKLANLRKLRVVSLNMMPKLADRTLTALAALPRLETLFLRCNTRITDAGLASLAGARHLKRLHLDYARNLTGERMLELARKLPLEELMVATSPHVTDEHVMKLAKHPTLRRVSIRECKNVDKDTHKALAAARPDWTWPSFTNWPRL